ncbi:MAG: hypothetical protein JW850_02070 [Thermoflexales bacterium]|nr:hypothetical protein [Thermoflexales bacterium]
MMERYALVSGRIRQGLGDLERVVGRVEAAIDAARQRPGEQDFYLDSAALNLHDFYAGLERVLRYVASQVDQNVPTGVEWHRELLRQMNAEISRVRPPVLSAESVCALDEYLRFRHVVRNVYTFNFDPERIERLVKQLRPCFERIQADLLVFAEFMDGLAAGED